MNQIIQYLLLFGVTGIFFSALYAETIDDISRSSLSFRDRVELYKAQAGEGAAFIDVQGSGSILTVTVVGTGTETTLMKVYVNGDEKTSDSKCYDAGGNRIDPCVLTQDELLDVEITLTPMPPDPEIALVTENGRAFTFP